MKLHMILLWKGTSAPVAPFERVQGEMLTMPPFSGVPVRIILHALCLLVAVGYNGHCNEHKLPAIPM